jgi:hypothetical protein
MDALPPEWTGWRGWARDFAFATAVGVCMGLIGPFGTYLTALPFRVPYWVGILWIGMAIFGLTIRLALWAARRTPIPAALWLLATIVVASAPMSLVSAVIATHFWPDLARLSRLEWYGQSAALSTPLVMGWGMFSRRMAPFARRPGAETPLGRLPERLTRGLVCLQMEDHYVRVHGRRGSELVLISMREAVAGLSPQLGERVHRSWWVAREAVTGFVADGRNLRLTLVNGLEAPVARSAVGKLRAAGWFQTPAAPGQVAQTSEP